MKTVPYYPRLILRVRALLIDSVILPVAAIATLLIGASLGVSGTAAKILLMVVPILLLDPLLVSITGGTIGHHLTGIKVTRKNGVDHLNIIASTVRFFVKLLFGWFSFVAVFMTRKHQAIHDLAAGSVVTYRNTTGLPPRDLLPERSIEESGFVYPAMWKRIMAIFLYGFAVVIANAIVGAQVLSDACVMADHCIGAEYFLLIVFNMLFLFMLGAVIVMGWKGRLFGARRTALAPEVAQ